MNHTIFHTFYMESTHGFFMGEKLVVIGNTSERRLGEEERIFISCESTSLGQARVRVINPLPTSYRKQFKETEEHVQSINT